MPSGLRAGAAFAGLGSPCISLEWGFDIPDAGSGIDNALLISAAATAIAAGVCGERKTRTVQVKATV